MALKKCVKQIGAPFLMFAEFYHVRSSGKIFALRVILFNGVFTNFHFRFGCNKRIKHSFPCINVCQAQGQ